MGGAQTRFMQMLRYSQAQNYEHYVFALNGCYDLLEKWPQDAVRPEIYKGLTYKKGAFFENIKSFHSCFKSGYFDLVQTQNWPTIEAVMANTPQNLPHIHNEDGFGADEASGLKLRRNIIRRIFLTGKKLLVPSMVLKNIALNMWNTPWTDIHYVPNGISDIVICETQKPQSDKIIFVTVAMLRQEKNIEAMIDMIAFLKEQGRDILLKIIGSGPEEDALKSYAKNLNLTEEHILFLGFKSDYIADIQSSDIFLLSSKTEQQPYSLLQAMACMKPILSTDVGDIFYMVSKENQKYVSKDAFTAPYDLVQQLMDYPEALKDIGLANKTWQKHHYDIEISLKKRYEIINNL